jgi:hypothetical protein
VRNRTFNSAIIHEAIKRSEDMINRRPKLEHPDKDGVPADVPLQAQNDPKFARQIMGFREWCETVYEPTPATSTRQETDR